MKQYLVFAGDIYYPGGGWGDFKKSFETRDEALVAVANGGWEWWHIVDGASGVVVEEGIRGA